MQPLTLIQYGATPVVTDNPDYATTCESVNHGRVPVLANVVPDP